MKFKHITGWAKNEIDFNKIYETNWVESNYWKNKQLNENEIQEVADSLISILQAITNSLNLKYDFTPLSKELQKSKYYSELLKEYIFEEIRANEYPDKPSRKKCMFLAPDEIDIFDYAQNLKYNVSEKTFLEIELLEDSICHFADLTLLNCNGDTHTEKVEKAKKYWQGTEKRGFESEILVVGRFKINNIIEPTIK